jgi:hypothetical protein
MVIMKMRKGIFIILLVLVLSFISVASVSALSIVTHVPEKYTDVVAGERFYFEIEIKYPENPSRKDLKLNYEISNGGKVIAQAKVLKAVENQASFMDFIVIPESAEPGMHIIKVKISDYESLSEEVEASFHVVSGSGGEIKNYFFILLGAVGLVGILVVVNILKKRG